MSTRRIFAERFPSCGENWRHAMRIVSKGGDGWSKGGYKKLLLFTVPPGPPREPRYKSFKLINIRSFRLFQLSVADLFDPNTAQIRIVVTIICTTSNTQLTNSGRFSETYHELFTSLVAAGS